MIRRIFCIAFITVFTLGTALAQKPKKYVLTIGGHNQNAEHGSLVDLKAGKTYKIADVSNQGDIDLLYAYGKTSSANVMTPSSTAVKQFGANYREKIDEVWETKNRGHFVVIKTDKKNKKLYKDLKKNEDIQNLYTETAKSVKELEDYSLIKYGPARRISNLEVGDLLVFRSQDRKFHAAGLVLDIKEGVRGYIDIDFKITE